MRRALITGIGGQDGYLLARELLAHGRSVVGTVRPSTSWRSDVLTYLPKQEHLRVVEHDVRDGVGFAHLIEKHRFDEIYNLASFSSVGLSWQNAELVAEINGNAVLRMLEALRMYADRHGTAPRFYQASTSEIFGLADEQPQTELTPHHPRSPYAVAKSFAHYLTLNYRESYGLFTTSGILYNHESPVRGAGFVTRKITRGVAEIALGRRESLTLGNLDVRRDWGHAADYVRSMRLMLEADDPADYIVATGIAHSLEDFLRTAFEVAGLGEPAPYLTQDPALMRPADVMELRGDATKAREQLGWTTTRTLREIIDEMVAVDARRVETGVEEDPSYLPAVVD